MTSTPATASERRAEALRRAAQAKRQAAITRADTAIRKLIKDREEINFRSVARTAGVSLDFLYANDDLRHRIEKLRTQQTARPAPEPAAADHDDIVHILTSKLREERDARRTTVTGLETQIAAAHGELLRLRRLLNQHGITTG
jgi:integrase